MDRVFVYGGIYDSRHRHENGVMRGKRALLTVTAGASAQACAPDGRDGDMRADAVANHACAALYRL
ncbi:Putative NADPH-quinone reductase (modulator of drug activity B) [Serratia marcescens]|uniref:NADPH-quinone reductase (Modulator of drug activity B) n=1 Tax=Serratia marcescens TaxID=615 RepID=A0A380ARS3_SERMA|nr:Putative NADPH-quinone reductase (modulator of drug activity B) [Serratia marcescens]